ncbi:MAG TPA: muconolactone Delta-isomerase family protein [Candidatus Baltobacteraceae bacterium]|jgi:muconolactone delta-isomerase
MQFVAILRRRTEAFSHEEFAVHLDAEAQRVRELYASGKLRAAWGREDVLGAVLMLECDDRAEADAVVASLPLALHGMLEATLIPLRGYRGFGPR